MRLSPRTTKSYVYFCGTFSDGINPACSRHKIDQEDVNKAVFAQISNHMRCCIDALRVIRELNARSSGLKKYDVYEKAITRQRRELEKVNRKFSELYGDYSEHLINESEYLTLKQQYLLKSEALKKEIDNLLISQNLYSKNYKIDADWENLINKYLKCRKLNKELADVKRSKAMVEQIDELHQEIEQLKTEIPPEDNSSSKFETQLESIINMESFDREKIQKVIKKVIINGEDNIEIIWNTDDPFFK